jgi:hypothetical protein
VIGVQKLDEANVKVDEMKEILEGLKPILEEKSRDCEIIMSKLDIETKEVDVVRLVVEE